MHERKRFRLPGIADDGRPQCPVCHCRHFVVQHSFGWDDGSKRRRRQCRNCGWVLQTIEVPLEKPPPT